MASNEPAPSLTEAETAAIARLRAAPFPLPLACGVQHYQWGQRASDAYIPRFLGVPATPGVPYAELWIGDNAALPSRARLSPDVEVALPALVNAAADTLLAPSSGGGRSAGLPFLTKILAADQSLSIQVHPSLRQAQAGFAEENARGVPPRDERRNFKDANHKPELLVALTPFWGLKGFRPLEEIAATLRDEAPELAPLAPRLDDELAAAGREPAARAEILRALYTRAMRMEQAAVNGLLEPLLERLKRQPLTEAEPGYWVLLAARDHARGADRDRGLFSFYLLNLIEAAPGQGIFLGPGEPHAYLSGAGIEVMANSDNVLRGGLTPKHVDIDRLLDILVFADEPARLIEPDAASVYDTPVSEFQVARAALAAGAVVARAAGHGADVWVVTSGEARLTWDGGQTIVRRGTPVLVPAAMGAYTLASSDGAAVLAFRASEKI